MNILYFSPIIWDDLKQRPQHLAEELSRYYKIYYVEPSISFIKSIINKSNLYKERYIKINTNLDVIRISGKWKLPKSLDIIDIFNFSIIYERRKLKKLIDISDIIWIGSPVFYDIVKDSNKIIIYDKMDDYVYLTSNWLLKKSIKKNESELLKRSDKIFVSSYYFYDKLKEFGKEVYIVNNGVNKNFLDLKNRYNNDIIINFISEIKKHEGTVFGYLGTIDKWFDYEAIKTILEFNSKFYIFLIGNNNLPKIKYERLYYFNRVDKERVPGIINHIDYCLYTFKNNNFVNTIDPVKIYEYLSLNKRVIAIESSETLKFGNKIITYKNNEELKNCLKNIYKTNLPFSNKVELMNYINNNSWESRAKFIKDVLEKTF